MDWSGILLTLVTLFLGFRLGILSYKLRNLMYVGYSVALLGFSLSSAIPIVIEHFQETEVMLDKIAIWSDIVSISFVLCALTVLIRNSKPEFARFPLTFTALPLLIILTFPLAHETEVIHNWLMKVYQGGAIFVGLLMYGFLSYKNHRFVTMLSGVVVIAASYIAYWFVNGVQSDYSWVWQTSMIVGLITTYLGARKV